MVMQSFSKILCGGVALSLGLLASMPNSAQAATFDFTVLGATNLGTSEVFTSLDMSTSLTVFGFADLTPIGSPTTGNIIQSLQGLGVENAPPTNTNVGIRNRVGRTGSTIEGLEFSFTSSTNLNSVNFDGFAPGSQFRVAVDGTIDPTIFSVGSLVNLPLTGTDFTFYPSDDASQFRIAGMTVTESPQIPEPSSLLGLVALGGIAAVSRLKNKQKQL